MLPDRVSNPGPLTYESGALPIVLRGPANVILRNLLMITVKKNTVPWNQQSRQFLQRVFVSVLQIV